MADELRPGDRVQTPVGPGTVAADDESGRRSALSVCVELDRPGARAARRLFFEPAELQPVLL